MIQSADNEVTLKFIKSTLEQRGVRRLLQKSCGYENQIASNGEPWAIKELADRLDGRPMQTNVLEASEESELSTIKIVFVSPDGREVDDVTGLNMSN